MSTNTSIQTAEWLGLPAATRTHATVLFNQQCWLWGQDIRREAGNALVAYGFTRQRHEDTAKGSSAYVRELAEGQQVMLFAFGTWWGGAAGGIFVPRYTFAPLLMPMPVAPLPALPQQLPPSCAPRDAAENARALAMTCALLDWIGDYEAWARATCGMAFRAQCVEQWAEKHHSTPAATLPEQWRNLARCVAWHGQREHTQPPT